MSNKERFDMSKTPKKGTLYIKIAIISIILLLGYFFIPMGQNNSFNNAAKLRGTSNNNQPIKLQFRSGFQHDKYEAPKKSTFMQKRMEESDEDKKPIFWEKK
jgi:hypothetical protein